jgi:hypothetical protein
VAKDALVVLGVELVTLSSSRRGTTDAGVQSVVNEDITINAEELLALRALKQIFVRLAKFPLASNAVSCLVLIQNLYEA